MITLFIIIIIICAIASSKPDKRDKGQMDADIAQLPKFTLQSKQLSSIDKFLNLAYENKYLLDTFSYNSGNVNLKMRNSKIISSKLSDLEVRFEDFKGTTYITVKSKGGVKVKFTHMAKLFTDEEWELIFRVLSLAGTTYGISIFSKSYKNMKSANMILKIISKL